MTHNTAPAEAQRTLAAQAHAATDAYDAAVARIAPRDRRVKTADTAGIPSDATPRGRYLSACEYCDRYRRSCGRHGDPFATGGLLSELSVSHRADQD